MEKNPTKVDEVLKLDYSKPEEIGLTQQKTLRKLVGVLGMLLPILLGAFVFAMDGHWEPLDSISHYYYTRSNGLFVIIISLVAIFLMVYKGKHPIDFYLSFLAGFSAICLLLFPTSNLSQSCCDPNMSYSVTFLADNKIRVIFHYVASGIFLFSLACISLFIFTKSNKSEQARGKNKRIRNRVYRTCGTIMILAMLVLLGGPLGLIPDYVFTTYKLTFWMEVVALESFGFSWMVKGEMFLKD